MKYNSRMPGVAHILKMRHRREGSLNRRMGIGAGFGCSLALSLAVVISAASIVLVYIGLTSDLPAIESLPALLEPPDGLLLQPTLFYDQSREWVIHKLENPAAEGHQYLRLDYQLPDHLPESLIDATIASADPEFWSRPGFSLFRRQGGGARGIAQQLVSDLLLTDEPAGLRRSMREHLLAAQITQHFGRERILEWYLNSADYGHLAFGADAAARVYFDKPANRLSLIESAILAATVQAPGLNPLDTPQLAYERAYGVLKAMLDQKLISESEYRQARQARVKFRQAQIMPDQMAPAFINLVLDQLSTEFDLYQLQRGGLRITTSLNYGLQLQVECAAATQLARLAGEPDPPGARDGSPCMAANLLPTLAALAGEPEEGLAGEVGVMDPTSGQVLALVALELDPIRADTQADSEKQPFPRIRSREHLGRHTTGTLLTPFLYLTAFSRGFSPASLAWDIPDFASQSAADLAVEYHGPVRLRMALANDYLEPAAQLLEQIGQENVWQTTRLVGLDLLPYESGDKKPDGALTASNSALKAFLEGTPLDLLQASQAYASLANQGVQVGRARPILNARAGPYSPEPITVLRVESLRGETWEIAKEEGQETPVISQQLAYLVTDVLSDEPARWPSLGHPNPLEVGRPAAAKLGRTSDGQDIWVVGYTPSRVVSVWLGAKSHAEAAPPTTSAAAAVWHAVIKYASQESPAVGWNPPAGLTTMEVCDPSGLLPTADCPNLVREVFLDGSQPTHPDNLYRRLQVNRETGRLATVFTPPELIEEQVYMVLPEEAQAWAQQAGLPQPPETYDVIYLPSQPSPDSQISSPAMFAYVSGQVVIEGTAAGEGFRSYRLQVGKGVNPREWIQVGQDHERAVEAGELGRWDASGLNGLYAIQLLVLREDQRVESAIIQVTVDNQPPEIVSLYPVDGQELKVAPGASLVVRAQVSDDLGIKEVIFYLDGRLIDSRSQPPFVAAWQAGKRKHVLRVKAVDLAGNATEADVEFMVR